MTLNDDVVSAIEKTLLSSPASYPYLEMITKIFLASAGLQSWKQEDVFGREPIRRLAICLNTNEAFLGSKLLNLFTIENSIWNKFAFTVMVFPLLIVLFQLMIQNLFTLALCQI